MYNLSNYHCLKTRLQQLNNQTNLKNISNKNKKVCTSSLEQLGSFNIFYS